MSSLAALLVSAMPAVAQPSPASGKLPTISQADVQTAPTQAGLEFEGFGTPNTGRIIDTIYQGECPGEAQGTLKARFYSTATPPGTGRRVVIRNVSRGLAGDTIPFTDRDYSKGRTSEPTSAQFGTQHELTRFTVLEGQNNLEYEIKQGSNVIEKGAFTTELSRSERTRNRQALCSSETYCRGSEGTSLKKCKDVRTRLRCYCADKPGNTFIRDRY
ncbi:MAG: hypothetical protein KME42_22665 [Tildeniella nuda ZEHNDER 1965/U140]|nr:hypothetical protein [Tildeniella nuda ZEHNDER 1965/U140]